MSSQRNVVGVCHPSKGISRFLADTAREVREGSSVTCFPGVSVKLYQAKGHGNFIPICAGFYMEKTSGTLTSALVWLL